MSGKMYVCDSLNRNRERAMILTSILFLSSQQQPFYRSPTSSSPADSRRSFSPTFSYPACQPQQRASRPSSYQTYNLNGPSAPLPTMPQVQSSPFPTGVLFPFPRLRTLILLCPILMDNRGFLFRRMLCGMLGIFFILPRAHALPVTFPCF